MREVKEETNLDESSWTEDIFKEKFYPSMKEIKDKLIELNYLNN